MLRPNSNRSPYTFYASSGSKNRAYIIHAFINKANIVNEYDQEIPQSQTADKPVASWGRAMQQSRVTRKIRVKVPPFQKVSLFLRYKIFHRDVTDIYFCLFEDVTDYCDILRRKKLCFDRTLLFATR